MAGFPIQDLTGTAHSTSHGEVAVSRGHLVACFSIVTIRSEVTWCRERHSRVQIAAKGGIELIPFAVTGPAWLSWSTVIARITIRVIRCYTRAAENGDGERNTRDESCHFAIRVVVPRSVAIREALMDRVKSV